MASLIVILIVIALIVAILEIVLDFGYVFVETIFGLIQEIIPSINWWDTLKDDQSISRMIIVNVLLLVVLILIFASGYLGQFGLLVFLSQFVLFVLYGLLDGNEWSTGKVYLFGIIALLIATLIHAFIVHIKPSTLPFWGQFAFGIVPATVLVFIITFGTICIGAFTSAASEQLMQEYMFGSLKIWYIVISAIITIVLIGLDSFVVKKVMDREDERQIEEVKKLMMQKYMNKVIEYKKNQINNNDATYKQDSSIEEKTYKPEGEKDS